MKKYIKEYNEIVESDNSENHDELVYKAFMKVISNCPQGVELFMRVSTNSKQLQTMYYQRKNHRLRRKAMPHIPKYIPMLSHYL
jgi:hypothetical protein